MELVSWQASGVEGCVAPGTWDSRNEHAPTALEMLHESTRAATTWLCPRHPEEQLGSRCRSWPVPAVSYDSCLPSVIWWGTPPMVRRHHPPGASVPAQPWSTTERPLCWGARETGKVHAACRLPHCQLCAGATPAGQAAGEGVWASQAGGQGAGRLRVQLWAACAALLSGQQGVGPLRSALPVQTA